MTHAEYVRNASREVATKLPGYSDFDPAIQQILLELGEEYFAEEFLPRLNGMINVPRYHVAKYEKTPADRDFIEEQSEYLQTCVEKARNAAYDQLLEKLQEIQRRGANLRSKRL